MSASRARRGVREKHMTSAGSAAARLGYNVYETSKHSNVSNNVLRQLIVLHHISLQSLEHKLSNDTLLVAIKLFQRQ